MHDELGECIQEDIDLSLAKSINQSSVLKQESELVSPEVDNEQTELLIHIQKLASYLNRDRDSPGTHNNS